MAMCLEELVYESARVLVHESDKSEEMGKDQVEIDLLKYQEVGRSSVMSD